jgi:hypothetical protein
MMMKTNFLAFFLLLLSTQLVAQESVTEVKKHAFENPFHPANQDAITMLNRMNEYKEYSLMLFESWQPMVVVGKDSLSLRIDSANYHIEQDKFFFVRQGKVFQLFPEKLIYAIIGNRMFVNRPMQLEDKRVKLQYFEVLEDGEYALLKKYEIRRDVSNDHPMGIAAATEVTYKRNLDYFFLRKEARLPEEIPSRKKDFIMIFRKHRPEMVTFARDHHISLTNEHDLRAIFIYYNKLALEQSLQ